MPTKTWREKLQNANGLPKIVKLKKNGAKHWKGSSMTIPSPMEINNLMTKVPKGKLTTTDDLRKSIARKHKTDIACPLTTGIFSWISAHTAEEDRASGKKRFTPYWRTLKTGGIINPKYPGGLENQKKLLKSEGHKIITKGKNLKVENYEKNLAKI